MGALLQTSEGDMRKAITTLQSCARLKEGAEDAGEFGTLIDIKHANFCEQVAARTRICPQPHCVNNVTLLE